MEYQYAMLKALAFLPSADIPGAFDAVVSNMIKQNSLPFFATMIQYMKNWWIRPSHATVAFPPDQWSVHIAFLTDHPRVNNRIEDWHSKIENCLKTGYADIDLFMFALGKFFLAEMDHRRLKRVDDDSARRSNVVQSIALPSPSPKSFSLRADDLKSLCQDYQNGSYVTTPIRIGYIHYLLEVAAIFMNR